MKNHLIAFGTLLLFAAAFQLAAQDQDAIAQTAARLAAARAAEEGGSPAAAANPAETGVTNITDASATNSADATATNSAVAGATNAVSPVAATSADDDKDEIARKAALDAAKKNLPKNLTALDIIWKRNIFDPQRQPYIANRAVAAQVETFSLRGTSDIIDKGWVAFFVGDGVPAYPSTRCIGDMVGDFKITDITESNVTLINTKYVPRATPQATNIAIATNIATAIATNRATNSALARAPLGAEIVLKLDQGLTRTEGGPWNRYYYTPTYPVVAARAPQDNAQTLGAAALFAQVPMLTMDDSGGFSIGTDPNAGFTGRGRGRRGGGGGAGGVGGFGGGRGGGGRGGGGGGGFGGGFGGGAAGGGIGGGAVFAPVAPAAPTAAPDPAVLLRLQQQRAAEQ
jgi:hypothetical protein